MASDTLVKIDINNALKRVASGKVRDLFAIDEQTLLFVATDRISAFDVVMENGIPSKGALLTRLSQFWFQYLSTTIPSLATHFLGTTLPAPLSATHPALVPRSMVVRRLTPFPLESIVRGYITGSAWTEYCALGTVHGIPISGPRLREGDAFPSPLWTPSTKAPAGQRDENISPDEAVRLVGPRYAKAIAEASLRLYEVAHAYARGKGIIIADTKFEFADAEGGSQGEPRVVLIDEVLTPDSSRFWPVDGYAPGGPQKSFDKQYLRDWLVSEGLKGIEGVRMPDEVVERTREKYQDAYDMLTAS